MAGVGEEQPRSDSRLTALLALAPDRSRGAPDSITSAVNNLEPTVDGQTSTDHRHDDGFRSRSITADDPGIPAGQRHDDSLRPHRRRRCGAAATVAEPPAKRSSTTRRRRLRPWAHQHNLGQLRQVASKLRTFRQPLVAVSRWAHQPLGTSTAIEPMARQLIATQFQPVNDQTGVRQPDRRGARTDGRDGADRAAPHRVRPTIAQSITGFEITEAQYAERQRPARRSSTTPTRRRSPSPGHRTRRHVGLQHHLVALVLASIRSTLRRCCDAVTMSDGSRDRDPTTCHTIVAMFADPQRRTRRHRCDRPLEATVLTMMADLANDELGRSSAVLEVIRRATSSAGSHPHRQRSRFGRVRRRARVVDGGERALRPRPRGGKSNCWPGPSRQR